MGFFCRRWLPSGKCFHLITLRLGTALIDDVGRTCMVAGVIQALRAPAGAAGESWLLASGGGLAPCRAHLPGEGGPALPISCSFGSILISLSCMLVLQVSWPFDLWLAFVLSVHESGENACPCIFSLTHGHVVIVAPIWTATQ